MVEKYLKGLHKYEIGGNPKSSKVILHLVVIIKNQTTHMIIISGALCVHYYVFHNIQLLLNG